ncbi:MAG: J domain-containing protein [Lentisphaerales bacterium]|nr:J domain-containing protein [Lentisphaerales bacterium]
MSDFNINDPYDFFELADGFTKKDLKRAYTKKIKQYKPEKFPDEFMKIRAAFEQLEQELAYGKPYRQNKKSHKKVELTEEMEAQIAEFLSLPQEGENLQINIQLTQGKEAENKSLPDLQDTIDEIQQTPFVETYAHLSDDNYHEVCQKISQQDSSSIREQVLNLLLTEKDTGLEKVLDGFIELYKKYPDEPLIEQTLRYILREDMPKELLESTLLRLASCLGGFYYNCELLLHKYLCKFSFKEFIELLERCENRLSFDEKHDSSIFYCRLIHRYFFRISEKWRNDKIQYINEFLSLENDYLDEKLDYIELLTSFVASLKDYKDHEKYLKQELIQCIQTYQETPGLQAENCFYELMKKFRQQDFLVDNLNSESQHIQPAYRILSMISQDFHFSRNIQPDETDNTLTVYHFLQKLNAGKYDSIPQLMGLLMFFKTLTKITIFAGIALCLLRCALVLFSLTGTYSEDSTAMFTLVMLIIIPLLTLKPYKLVWAKCQSFYDKRSINMSLKQYEKLRRPLVHFLAENSISEEDLTKCINNYENSNIQCSYLQIGIGNDYAISLGAIAGIHKS